MTLSSRLAHQAPHKIVEMFAHDLFAKAGFHLTNNASGPCSNAPRDIRRSRLAHVQALHNVVELIEITGSEY